MAIWDRFLQSSFAVLFTLLFFVATTSAQVVFDPKSIYQGCSFSDLLRTKDLRALDSQKDLIGSNLISSKIRYNNYSDKIESAPSTSPNNSNAVPTELLPYQAMGYRFIVLGHNDPLPPGYEQPNYNDSNWGLGQAAFGFARGYCSIQSTVRTLWPENTRLLVRRPIMIPENSQNVRIKIAVDNRVENLFFNGVQIQNRPIENIDCPLLDEHEIAVPQELVRAGNNLIAYQVYDYGFETYFDTRVIADVSTVINQPPTAGFTVTYGQQSATESQTLTVSSLTTPVTLNFTANRSTDLDGSIVAWNWKINGQPVSNVASFSFGLNYGNHIVTLSVTDNKGAVSQEVSGQILINRVNQVRPVIVIPGIGGSELGLGDNITTYLQGWPGDVLNLGTGEPENLQFDGLGQPRLDKISHLLKPQGLWDIPGKPDITDLFHFLNSNGYTRNENLFEFAYDFRRPVEENAAELRNFIQYVLSRSGSDKVNIVAHSMGGLVAKQYLTIPQDAARVDTIVMLGSPHLGAPKALKVLRYGDDFESLLGVKNLNIGFDNINLGVTALNSCKVKSAAHNMPGVFNLLPGRKYFELRGGYFFDEADIDNYVSENGPGRLNFNDMVYNLKFGNDRFICPLREGIDMNPILGLSPFLVNKHMVQFHDNLDNWIKPPGVKLFIIAGWGRSTLVFIREAPAKKPEDRYIPTCTTEGDGTVPLWSAETINADAVFYANFSNYALRTNHGDMVSNIQIQSYVLDLLKQTGRLPPPGISVSRPTNFSTVNCDADEKIPKQGSW